MFAALRVRSRWLSLFIDEWGWSDYQQFACTLVHFPGICTLLNIPDFRECNPEHLTELVHNDTQTSFLHNKDDCPPACPESVYSCESIANDLREPFANNYHQSCESSFSHRRNRFDRFRLASACGVTMTVCRLSKLNGDGTTTRNSQAFFFVLCEFVRDSEFPLSGNAILNAA